MSFTRPHKRLPGSGEQHPLLTLIQHQSARSAGAHRRHKDETGAAGDHRTGVGDHYDSGQLEDNDVYRLPQYQSQPADLSLNSEHYDPPHLFFRHLTSTGHAQTAPYDGYYGPGGQYDTGADSGQYHSSSGDTYHDYYSRALYNTGYDDTERLSYSTPPDLSSYPASLRYETPLSEYPMVTGHQSTPLLPPPLHPSPAVLLHIKYVMESVCESMSFTDVTIITTTDTLRAHRSILSAHSAFLNYILNTSDDPQEEPVIFFPTYPSLYVRMLLQFFYTGEVTTMTQRDIEPLRDICYSLGISSLITRLDDVKLSISFQNIPSSSDNNDNSNNNPVVIVPELNIKRDSTEEEVNQQEDALTEEEPKISSCKFDEPREKTKPRIRESIEETSESRRYTVVSKMPKNTKLQVSMKCPKCDLRFYKESQLNDHLKVHLGIKPKECEVCKKTFNSNYHLQTHMRIHSGSKPFSCSECGKDFSDPSSLRRHQNTHSGLKPFKCKVCGKDFTDRSSKRRHEQSHENTTFTCNLCNRSFTRKSLLKHHQLKQHGVENCQEPNKEDSGDKNVHECSHCKAVFKTPGKLEQHVAAVHEGKKTLNCDKCDKKFARKSNLQLHMRTHTGEKPHACARCGRCFSDVSAFRRHVRIHNGERPYKCKDCGDKFTQASTLHNHKRSCRRKKLLQCDDIKEGKLTNIRKEISSN